MVLTRKETAWKKSRKFGDVKGGRRWPKVTDNIFKRYHSLPKPPPEAVLPLFIHENPGRDFYFPVTEADIRQQIARLPVEDTARLTHIWLRHLKKKDYEKGDSVQGMYIRGSGVFLIVLHPFPKDLKMAFRERKPIKRTLNYYSAWTNDLLFDEEKSAWYLKWTENAISDYYLNSLLLHEIGHHVDAFPSKADRKKYEDFADDYAVTWRTVLGTNL